MEAPLEALTIHTLYTHTYAVAETLPPAMEEVELYFNFIIFEPQRQAKAEVMQKLKTSNAGSQPALMLSSGTSASEGSAS